MPRYDGTVKRLRPRVNVMRGYTGNEPQSLSRSAPIAADTHSGGALKQIYSGQPIALTAGGEWELANHISAVVYIAYHDSDDTDVLSCGKLLGFSCLGEYELESPWFSDGGMTAVTGADIKVQISNVRGYWTATGGGDLGGGTIYHGRTMAKTDLALGGTGGNPNAFANMGEDDSSGFYGVAASPAVEGTNTLVNTSVGVGDVITITLTEADSTVHSVDVTVAAADDGLTEALTLAAIQTLEAASPSLDASIVSYIGNGAGTIVITTTAGTASNLVSGNSSTNVGGGVPVATAVDVAGTDATSGTSKNVVRFVTTAS